MVFSGRQVAAQVSKQLMTLINADQLKRITMVRIDELTISQSSWISSIAGDRKERQSVAASTRKITMGPGWKALIDKGSVVATGRSHDWQTDLKVRALTAKGERRCQRQMRRGRSKRAQSCDFAHWQSA